MKPLLVLLLAVLPLSAAPVVYDGGDGIGKGKHIVFVASDHEYRAEETCPALARILAKRHGFKCTVCFGVDADGFIEGGASNVPGLEALQDADLMVIFTRFLNLPAEQMDHIVDYLDRGGPVVGMRTSSHAFKIPGDSPYAKYDFQSKVPGYEKGFGHQVLGNTWVGHYGRNHVQATRIKLVPEQKDHPVLRGVGDNALCHAGAYNGEPRDDFTVLTKSQPLVNMERDGAPDPKKPPVASTWTRHYTGKSGTKGRVFHSTQGASEDVVDPDYRRLLINGILWAAGMEKAIKPDLAIDFVGPYQPNTHRNPGWARNVKPSDLAGWESPIMPKGEKHAPATRKPRQPKRAPKKPEAAKPAAAKPVPGAPDARNTKVNKPKPREDPKLADYYINLKTSPRPGDAPPLATALPLEIPKEARVAFIGNLLLDAERRNGHLETLLHQRFPGHRLSIRNLAWPADEVDLQPRPDNFGDLDQHLHYFKADLIIAAFGANESFAGRAGLADFGERLDKFLTHLKSRAYNGKTAPRVVLLSPAAHENVPEVKAADRNNANLALYSRALKAAAAEHKVAFVDVFPATAAAFGDPATRLTIDGNALNEDGHLAFARAAYRGLFDDTPPAIDEAVRALVKDKAAQFFHRYRPLNTFYYTGGRNKSYGYLDFLPAMRNFDLMAANRDAAIWSTARGRPAQPDDSNLPALDEVAESRGANEWLSPAGELAAFNVDPRFEVNCFASEEDFPELACPIQMRWDARGRLWVSCSTTYPHLYPGNKPVDRIVILEDTNRDGKADKCSTFADDLHIPLSFVLDGRGGAFVSEEPHLTHLRDTDGDGKADAREIVFTGFGCEDSHHALHDFVWTPGGDLLFRESIFHNSQVETAYGPVRARNSSWFLYHPSTRRLTAFGAYPNTNPWGVTFDKHGHHVASHPVFASTFHATNPPYPAQHPRANGMQAYSGVCGHDFVDYPQWPAAMQGGFIKVRYKPTNRVEFHKWIEKEDHFAEEYVSDLVFSTNLSFIPVDARFGPRGAFYVCDWYNPVKGHAQYSLRDPRRDRKSGRIWRIVPKGARLQDPPKIAGESVPRLLDHLKSPHYRVRYRAKRELRARDRQEVLPALDRWLGRTLDPHHLLEGLWLSQGLDAPNVPLLIALSNSENHLVAAAAYGPLRFWHEAVGTSRTTALLEKGVHHASQHVRREAVIAASYVGTPEAFEAILHVLDQPMGTHLAYAAATALGSENLSRHWQGGAHEERIRSFLAGQSTSARLKPSTGNAREANFDSQRGLQVVEIGCVPERLLFTKSGFTVKRNKPVKLTLSNPDATQHNLVILAAGTPVEEIGMAANEMAKSPAGLKKHFIPDDPRVLHHTRLLDPDTAETLRFIAPKKPGTYPFVCTFPGHWILMKGEMVVE
ncbi:MAG: hypothetical protein HKO57_10190 [Akkermansiaceae bacterium]|nr:hypothetical protein [Akkermansiaceae bacterium]